MRSSDIPVNKDVNSVAILPGSMKTHPKLILICKMPLHIVNPGVRESGSPFQSFGIST